MASRSTAATREGGRGRSDGDDSDVEAAAPARLPDGVAKTVLVASAASGFTPGPRAGDEVTLRLGDGGEAQFLVLPASSGWPELLASMRRGERADFAGDFDFGPLATTGSERSARVELLDWGARRDLFGDGSAVAVEVNGGDGPRGWKQPEAGQEVLLAVTAGGATLEASWTLGGEGGGPGAEALDLALMGAVRGQRLRLTFRAGCPWLHPEWRDGGAPAEVRLLELREEVDASLGRDGSVRKRRLFEGDGWEAPRDGARLRVLLGEGAAAVPFSFVAGAGEVCDALEGAVLEMRQGEVALVRAAADRWVRGEDGGETFRSLVRPLVTEDGGLHVRLESLVNEAEDQGENSLEAAASRKAVAVRHFLQGRTSLALVGFKRARELAAGQQAEEARQLSRACHLNEAACHLRLRQPVEASLAAAAVLQEEPRCFKALLRGAAAALELGGAEESVQMLSSALEVEPSSLEARGLLQRARAEAKRQAKVTQQLYAKMMGRSV